jgi:hypothetical protein
VFVVLRDNSVSSSKNKSKLDISDILEEDNIESLSNIDELSITPSMAELFEPSSDDDSLIFKNSSLILLKTPPQRPKAIKTIPSIQLCDKENRKSLQPRQISFLNSMKSCDSSSILKNRPILGENSAFSQLKIPVQPKKPIPIVQKPNENFNPFESFEKMRIDSPRLMPRMQKSAFMTPKVNVRGNSAQQFMPKLIPLYAEDPFCLFLV